MRKKTKDSLSCKDSSRTEKEERENPAFLPLEGERHVIMHARVNSGRTDMTKTAYKMKVNLHSFEKGKVESLPQTDTEVALLVEGKKKLRFSKRKR